MRSSFKNETSIGSPPGSGSLVTLIRLSLINVVAVGVLALVNGSAHAGVAYGSINNFDAVNDTGVPCYGFEIELDDIHSSDISYTYDWNHYGTPKITEDNRDPLHPKVFVRYASTRSNGVWTAYTAVPSSPILPTDGHQFYGSDGQLRGRALRGRL